MKLQTYFADSICFICSYIYEMLVSLINKSIRVCFTNFWSEHEPEKSLYLRIIKNVYSQVRVVKHYKPEIQVFSVFGDIGKLKKSKARVKIFYTGENTSNPIFKGLEPYKGNCIDYVSLSVGYEYYEIDNYIRSPTWMGLFSKNKNLSKDEIKAILDNSKQSFSKKKFCALISRHDLNGLRTKIYNDINNIAKVDCPGLLLHNDSSLKTEYNDNKQLYLQQYKFNICPENSIGEGYVTEKIFHSLLSGCIPIYNGWSKNPEPGIVNPDIILWYDEFDEQNNEYTLMKIRKLQENDKFYRSFIGQPFFCDTAVDKIYDMQNRLNEKISKIIYCKPKI